MPTRAHSLGDLRRRITVQQETRTPDGGGGFVIAWADVCTVWAKVWPITPREAMDGERLEARVDTLIVIRYRPGNTITAGMRISADGLLYQIKGLADVESRHEFIELTCTAGMGT